jgi:hypothetical protein
VKKFRLESVPAPPPSPADTAWMATITIHPSLSLSFCPLYSRLRVTEGRVGSEPNSTKGPRDWLLQYTELIIPPRGQNQSERRHGLTRVPGHPFLAWRISWKMVVYNSYVTAAGNFISSQLGSSCQGNWCGTGKGRRCGPSITYKITRLFRLFRFYTETESFDVSIEPKQTEDQPKPFDREHIWYFSENLGLFRFVSKQCLFQLFRYRVETPKQTETNRNFLFLVSRNKPKHNRNGSCFGLFRFEPKFF